MGFLPLGYRVWSFPQNTDRRGKRLSPLTSPTSTRTTLPDISSLPIVPVGTSGGSSNRARLTPSPISDKHVVELVVTSRGALHPKAKDAHQVHRQGRSPPLGGNPSHSP